MTTVVVLYEDQLVAHREYGPHALLLGMVADDSKQPWHALNKRAAPKPLNGVGNVLKRIKDPEQWRVLAPGGQAMVAIVDADKVREHVGVRGLTSAEVENRIRKSSAHPGRLTVVLLERNLESVVEAIRDCDTAGSLDAALIRDALDKDINARDQLMQKVGRDGNRREIRDCVRRRIPSLSRAVAAIRRAIAA